MKLRLVAAVFALVAIPALAHGQQGGPPPSVSKPTKADVQKVVQIISSDKAKLQSYCDLKKLYDQMGAAYRKNDSKTAEALGNQADALAGKIGPEYSKMMDGLEKVDQNSSEGKEFMSILSGLDKLCTGSTLAQPAQSAPAQPAPVQTAPAQTAPPQSVPAQPAPKGDPAPKSERYAHRLVLLPMAPIWALGSSWIAFDRLWPVRRNGGGPPSRCHKSTRR